MITPQKMLPHMLITALIVGSVFAAPPGAFRGIMAGLATVSGFITLYFVIRAAIESASREIQ